MTRAELIADAPEEAVAQGVTFGWWPERQSYVIAAGVPRYPLRWMVDVAHADDPVLARVRAWQSVQDGR